MNNEDIQQLKQCITNGDAFMDSGRFQDAIQEYDHAIALNPNDPDAYWAKGNSLMDLRNYEEALAAFENAISLNPNDPETYRAKGNLFMDLSNYEEALSAFEQAMSLNPHDPETYLNKASILRTLERHEEALQAVNESISLNSNDPYSLTIKSQEKKDIYKGRMISMSDSFYRKLNNYLKYNPTEGNRSSFMVRIVSEYIDKKQNNI